VLFSLLTAALLLGSGPGLAQTPPVTTTPPPTGDSAAPAPAPTEAAPTPAPTDAAPPASAPVETTASTPDPAVAQDTYKAQKLTRKALKPEDPLYLPTLRATPDQSVAPWAVYRGDGSVVTAYQLAGQVGDSALVTKMDKGTKRSKILRWSLTGVGVGLIGLTVLPLINMEDVGELGKEPDPNKYPDAQTYTSALVLWRQQREDSNQNQNRLLSAITLGTTGALTIAVSPFATSGTRERQRIVPAWYTADQVDEKVLSANIALKRQLGLTAPEPTEVIIQPPPPQEPKDLPDDGGEDIDIPEPSGGGGAPPADLQRLPYLELSPMIGVGFIGIQGTF